MYQNYKKLIVTKQDKIVVVKFNDPKKKNCVNRESYIEITKVLQDASKDDAVTMVVFTGVGDFYTSGMDLSQWDGIDDLDAYIQESKIVLKTMLRTFIDCPKIIVSLVNGPCIGIGTTLVAISDLVWCAEAAYFSTPFVKLGIVPEAGSSYLFPLVMGRSKATEVLLFGEKLMAQEAYNFNFVSRIFKNSELDTVVWQKLREFSKLPPQSLQISKKLVRSNEKKTLLNTIDVEFELLQKRYVSEEFMNALSHFTMRKSKL